MAGKGNAKIEQKWNNEFSLVSHIRIDKGTLSTGNTGTNQKEQKYKINKNLLECSFYVTFHVSC